MNGFETYYKASMPGCFNADTLEGIADSLPGPYLFINPDEFNNPAEYLTAIRMRLPYKEVAALNQYGTHIEDILEAGYAQIKIEADSFEMFRNHLRGRLFYSLNKAKHFQA